MIQSNKTLKRPSSFGGLYETLHKNKTICPVCPACGSYVKIELKLAGESNSPSQPECSCPGCGKKLILSIKVY